MQKIIDAEKSDLFDVLAHVAYALPTLTREERAAKAKVVISTHFNTKQQVFLDFVLSHYVQVGVEELDQEKLTPLLRSNITTPSPMPWPTWAGPRRSERSSRASRSISIWGGGEGGVQWERDNLFTRSRHDIAGCQYRAWNCAITAWHITDWVWENFSDELRKELRTKDVFEFQEYVRSQCPALKLCYQIATGSKHFLMKNNNTDPIVSALISDGQGYDCGNPIIMEGSTEHPADKVFFEAQVWFETFLSKKQYSS